mmetsp:Transcript_115158/g.372209  ORF Transcript_115158/g.372209 Transcript_115158/m.372209 type:complete len:93 (+) Transcript_115158:2-280(+)
MLIGLIVITVWEPFLTLWGVDKTIDSLSKSEKSSFHVTTLASLMVWWRTKAWILGYVIDFVVPILVISGVVGSRVCLITLSAYATTVHGLRV